MNGVWGKRPAKPWCGVLDCKRGSRHPPLGMFPNDMQRTIMAPTTTFCPNWACPARGQSLAEQGFASDCLQRPVRRSSLCNIPIADGKDSEDILGSAAYLNPKGQGNKSMPTKPGTAEDAETVARRDPRDMAKAILLEVQCPSVNGGPLATASKRQVDSSHRQADGLGDF